MHKKINLILLLLIVGLLLVIGYTQIFKQQPEQKMIDKQETPQNYQTLYVSLGEEFTLHKNQSAIIKTEGYEIKITKFFNSPCPKDAQCIWSGVGINFEYIYNGKIKEGTTLVQAFGYRTIIIGTDYKTYAKLKITKM